MGPVAALDPIAINPLRFVPVEGELSRDVRDNMIHFDADWFRNYIRDWQAKSDYIQPWQFNDRVAVYLPTNTDKGCTLQLIDCHGKIWKTWSLTNYAAEANDTIKVGNTSVPALVYYKHFRFADVGGLPEGIYWLYLTVAYDRDGDGTIDYYRHNITEPLSIATKHYGTVHVDYFHTTNAQDVLFVQTGIRFSIRVKGDVIDYSPNSTDTFFEDGRSDSALIASTPFRDIKFVLTRRVPEWVLEKLNCAWSCNTVTVDSQAFSKASGAKFDVGRLARLPKVTASLAIREGDRRQGTRQIVVSGFDLGTATFPYLFTGARLIDPGGAYFPFGVTVPVTIRNSSDETALVTAMNAFAAAEGWSGSISIVTSGIGGVNRTFHWTNSGNDIFLAGSLQVSLSPLSVQLTTTNVAQAIAFGNPSVYVDYGDGTIEAVFGTGTVSSPLHVYASSGTWNMLIFGYYQTIQFDDGFLNAVGGDASPGLLWFVLKNSFTITAFDCSALTVADGTLTILSVFNCSALATISNFGSLSLPAINIVSFASNALNTAQESQVIIDLDNAVNAGAPNGGYLYINGNATSSISSAAAIANSNLVSHGWHTLHD